MSKIGIIGQGFVGNAVKEGFKDKFEVLTYDKYISSKCNATLEEIVDQCEIIFACVPTPMNAQTGEASTHIVLEVIKEIDVIAFKLNKKPTVIIKSTVPVGTTSQIDNDTENCNIVFSPEFLTEANAVNDFKNQNRIILGINRGSYDVKVPDFAIFAKKVFQDIFMDKAQIIITGAPIAEMVKYVTNTFLATKVSFANEIYKITEASGINYDEVIELAKLDKRLGDSHWMVPGPDGDFGFGGHCFPKDLQALRFIASQLEIDTKILDATLSTNDEVRNDRDWERQEGRAIVNFDNETNHKGSNKKLEPIVLLFGVQIIIISYFVYTIVNYILNKS